MLPHQALDAAPRIPFGFKVFLSNFALPQGHFRSTGRRFLKGDLSISPVFQLDIIEFPTDFHLNQYFRILQLDMDDLAWFVAPFLGFSRTYPA